MRRFALIGKPLSHSFSAQYFTKKFTAQCIDACYDLIELDSIDQVRSKLLALDIAGFNVTIPFKQAIIPHLNSLSDSAKQIGAVNCVSIKKGKWIGHNTDAFGFESSLFAWVNPPIKNALVFGNGGSSQAVQFVLKKHNIDFKLVSRSGKLNYENLHPSHIAEAQLLVNTTPVGMSPSLNESLSIPYEAIGTKHHVMDLIYNPTETEFLKRCSLAGAKTKNGLEMLHLQAEESWRIWNRL